MKSSATARKTGPLERDPWGTFRFVRVGGATPYDDDIFSSLKDAPVFPSMMRKHQPVWPDGRRARQARRAGHVPRRTDRSSELDHPPADWLVLEREYSTQSIDTAALEPDNANCWYDAATQSLHMVVPTQAPHEVADSAAGMVAKCRVPGEEPVRCIRAIRSATDRRITSTCRSTAWSPRMYGDGRPVRLANDRYEQFQTSIKRHAFKMNYRIAVDTKTGLLQSFKAEFEVERRRALQLFAIGGDGRRDRRAIDLLLPEERSDARWRSRRGPSMPVPRAVTARCKAWPRPR